MGRLPGCPKRGGRGPGTHHHHHSRRKRSNDQSTYSTGRRELAGTAHTTPATLHATRNDHSFADSTTTPSNTYHLAPEADFESSNAMAPTNRSQAALQCVRQQSHFSLPEAQLECAKARLEEPETENGPDYSFQDTSTTPLRLMEDGRENHEGILLKTLRPYRTYSLRVARKASPHHQEQDSSFSNGPSRSHFGLFSGQQFTGDDNTHKNNSSGALSPKGCSTMVHCRSCQTITARGTTPDKEREEVREEPREDEEEEASSESECSEAHSELEVIMTTAC